MKTEDQKYGKSTLNPIKIKGVRESIAFMNLLITEDEKPFLFHRIKSTAVNNSKPIDCYEILKPNDAKDYVFINAYSTHKKSMPPEGYKFKTKKIMPAIINGFVVIETTGVNYRLRQFPDELFK
jgi:hypothetical protein